MNNHSKKFASLILAFVLLGVFAFLFYVNMFRKPKLEKKKATNPAAVEELIFKNARKDNANTKEEPSGSDEKFTFYKTLPTGSKQTSIADPDTNEAKIKEIPTRPQQSKADMDEPREAQVDKDKTVSEAKNFTRWLYSVQLISFSTFERADNFSKEMNKKGYGTFISASNYSKDVLYQVKTGKFDDYQKAKSLSDRINAKENLKSIVVKQER